MEEKISSFFSSTWNVFVDGFINKKLRNIQTKIDDIGLKTNYIEPQYEDIYTKLNLLSSMLNDIRDSKNSFYTNTNNEPRTEK